MTDLCDQPERGPNGGVYLEVWEADVVDDVPGANKERAAVLAQQLEVVGVGLVAQERFHLA